MKLEIQRKVECNRYSVIIKFKEFGSNTLTPEDEKKLINDFCPKFRLSDIEFNGKYKLEGKDIVKDNGSGQDVTLTIQNKEIAINELLEFGYTIHIKEIKESEKGGTLDTEDLVAKAKIKLFVDKITEKIDVILKDLEKTLDNFEETEEIQVG